MTIALMVFVTALKAQVFLPGSYNNGFSNGFFANSKGLNDSSSNNKWSLSTYSSVSTSFTFFRGGNAMIVSAPVGLQLSRRLNNNLFAFAGLSVAPAYVNFNQSFRVNDFSKANQNNTLIRTGNLGMYSRAELGLQYTNDERTFSISGSICVETSTYPLLHYG